MLSGSIGDGLTMNRYAYVNGNPVSFIDPFGLSADGATWWQTGLSFVADATPFVGTIKGIQEVFSGVDLITGQQLSVTDRVATGVGTVASVVPFGKHVGKYLAKEGIDGGAWLARQLNLRSFAKKTNQEIDLYRRTSNVGEFSHLTVPMQLREVKRLAEQAGVGLDGVKIKIIRDADMIRLPHAGWANPNGKEIQLYPNAFVDEEQLVKTLAHERTHIFQVRIYGEAKDIPRLNEFEEGAYGIEEPFWSYFNRKVK